MERKTENTCSVDRQVTSLPLLFGKKGAQVRCNEKDERPSGLLTAEDGVGICDGMGVHQFPWQSNTHMCEDDTDAEVFFGYLECHWKCNCISLQL